MVLYGGRIGVWVDFVCGYFWVWGNIAEMNLLLESRKASPLDLKFIIFSSFFTKLSFWFYKGK